MSALHVMDRVADLITAIGSPSFGTEFYRLFNETVGIEECTVFSFPRADEPRRLVVEGIDEHRRQRAFELADDYVAGGYREDPNLLRLTHDASTVIYLVESDTISDLGFRQHYYDDADLAHELVLLGRTNDTVFYSSFYRSQDRSTFEAGDLAAVRSLSNLVLKMLHRHYELVGLLEEKDQPAPSLPMPVQNREQREKTLVHMRDVLLSGPHNLSRREAEVCAGIVLGYSALAIGLNLGISPNTVATHRKRGYAKLCICSQNELFVRYFTAVKAFEASIRH